MTKEIPENYSARTRDYDNTNRRKKALQTSRDIYSNTDVLIPASLGTLRDTTLREQFRRDYCLILNDEHPGYSENFFEMLSYDLITWVLQTPSAKKISEYFLEIKHINRSTWYRWIKKSTPLRNAHNFAVEMIGIYLWRNHLEGKYKTENVYKAMPMYDPDFKALQIWTSKLGLSEQQRDAVYNILKTNLGKQNDETKQESPQKELPKAKSKKTKNPV